MGSFCSEGTVDGWKWFFAQTDRLTARYADLVIAAYTPAWSNTYAALTWLGSPFSISSSAWSFSLNSATNQVTASLTVTFALSSGLAGVVIYGVGLFGTPPNALIYTDALPAPYQVPTGGGTFSWTFNLSFGGCP